MPRHERVHHRDAFAPQGDFNEQLYLALKQSPWWMISILLHVAVFLIASMFANVKADPPPKKLIQASHVEEFEEEPPETEEDTEEVHEQETVAEEPVIKDEEIADHPETDNDLPYEESFGESEGNSDAPFEGPANNGTIGIGGGGGGAFRGRGGSKDTGTGGGGKKKFDDAVDDALKWLAAHQSPNGGWEAAAFRNWCDGKLVDDESKKPDGVGKAHYDPGVSGLSLCAFLGAGYTNRGKHPFARVVGKGLRYLKKKQDAEGCFGPRSTQQYTYNHATCSLAMVEAFGMTGSAIYKSSAQKCLDFIALCRNPYFAWRYGIRTGENDTSVTGWMMMALKSASLINKYAIKRGKPAPLVYDESAFEGIRAWLDKVTDPDYGRVGYVTRGTPPARPPELQDRFPPEKSESMTGVGMLARIFMGEDPRKSKIIKLGAELCLKTAPTWNPSDGSIDMYYWYYATLAMFQAGGKYWKGWESAMTKAFLPSQHKKTTYCELKGSWDPIGPWGPDGGRVYSTAVMAMCLQVLYRYDKVIGTK